MTKELSPLEALERIKSHNYHEHNKKECLEIIEDTLKDYDRQHVKINMYRKIIDDMGYMNLQKEKKLEVLWIIKEYFVLNGFDELIPIKNIPQEKYKLLKKEFL